MSNDVLSLVCNRERLASLRSLNLLDTPATEAFDRLARLAARILRAPAVFTSLVDENRQFFKSCLGLPEPWASWREAPLSHSFCQHVVATNQSLIINDARVHPLLGANPAIRDLKIVAYLGVPLTLPDGQTIGSFCVTDSVPRVWSQMDIDTVRDFAASVMSEIELHALRNRLESRIAQQAADLGSTHVKLDASRIEVQAAQARIVEVFERIADGFAALDRDWRYTYVNRRGAQILGRRPEDLIGKHIWTEFPEGMGQPFQRAYERAMAEQVPLQIEEYYAPWNRWFENHIYPAPEGISIFYHDITVRKDAESEARLLTRELEQRVAKRTAQLAETNAELESFSYTVSHDLRAPLRAVQGLAQALQEDYADALDTVGRDYTQRLIRAAEHMDGLILDLLAYSRLTRAELTAEVLDLGAIVQQAREQITTDIIKCKATIKVKKSLPAVTAHPATLLQVVTNLIANAIKFVAPGVRPEVNIRFEHRDHMVRLWVEDNGIGIEPEHQERIFRVFERLHGIENYPGTGIGLAIIRKGVERMNGATGVESTPGQGSRFWIELPSDRSNNHR